MHGYEQGRNLSEPSPSPIIPITKKFGPWSALGAPWPLRIVLILLTGMPALPLQAEPSPPSSAAPSRHTPLSAANFFRYQVPAGWSAIPEHPFGLSAEEKKVFAVTLHGPLRGEIPLRISAAYYAQGNLLYKSVAQYVRIFSPVSPAAGAEADAQGQARSITVSGREARMFERERKEFMPMHRPISPNDSPSRDDPRVYERRGEMMARAVPVRERFVVIPGKAGFHALRYSAAAEDFQEFLPDFEKLTATIEILE